MTRLALILIGLTLLLGVGPTEGYHHPDHHRTRDGYEVDISGTWYMMGNPYLPCYIQRYGWNRYLFVNEHGSQAWGTVNGNQIFVPAWLEESGQRGIVMSPTYIQWVPGTSIWTR